MSNQTIIHKYDGGDEKKSIKDMSYDELIDWMTSGHYEHYPSKIKHISISAEEKSQISYYDAMGRYGAPDYSGHQSGSTNTTGGGFVPWPLIVFACVGGVLVLVTIAGAGVW